MTSPVLTYRSLLAGIAGLLLVVGIILYVFVGQALSPTQMFFVVLGSCGVAGAWWLVARMVLEQRRAQGK